MKTALITGINGHVGSILARRLLSLNYRVHGIIRRSSNFNTQRIDDIFDKLTLHYGDLTDMGNVMNILKTVKPDEVYNLAAMSHVKVSFEMEKHTFEVNTLGVLNLLQSLVILDMKHVKFYQASTSEMFGNVTNGTKRLTETTEMLPVSPYGISKLASHHLCQYYRQAYGMFIVSNISLNHESEMRGNTFVTQKIASYVGKKVNKLTNKPLELGNVFAKRDWSYTSDIVNGIYMAMQYDTPHDFVLSSGEEHSVQEFANEAFAIGGMILRWEQKVINKQDGVYEVNAYDIETGEHLITTNSRYNRPIDIEHLIGDSSKAKKLLGWSPRVSFHELVKKMTIYQIELYKN